MNARINTPPMPHFVPGIDSAHPHYSGLIGWKYTWVILILSLFPAFEMTFSQDLQLQVIRENDLILQEAPPSRENANPEDQTEIIQIPEDLPSTRVQINGNAQDIPENWSSLEGPLASLGTREFHDILSFKNRDYLSGQLVAWDLQSHKLIWEYPDSPTPFEVDLGNVERIHLEERQSRSNDDPSDSPDIQKLRWRFFLTSGERIDGRMLSLNSESLTIENEWLGEVVVPRYFIEAIYPNYSYAQALYRGPDSLNGWTKGDVRLEEGDGGQWRYNRNAFYATEAASIARDVNLTPLSSIEIQAAWKGTLNFAVALYTDYLQPIRLADKENEPEFGPFYSLQIGSQSARLQSINKTDPIRQLGYAFIPTLNQKTQARFTILSDARSSTVTLLVDDQRVHTWRDTQGFFTKGKAIRIVHQGMGSIRLGSIVVRQWNGIIDSTNDRQVQYRTDVVQANNGETLKGSVSMINMDSLTMTLPNSSARQLLLNDIHAIHFQATEWKRPESDGENTRLEFYTGESILGLLHRIDAKGCYLQHAVFGKKVISHPIQVNTIQYIHP